MSWEKKINTIWCGDCLDLMKEMPDKSVDLILTDPPYGILDVEWDNIELKQFTIEWFSQIKRILKDGSGYLIFWSQKHIPLAFEILNPDRMLIWWHKNLAKPTNKMYLWTYDPIFFKKAKIFNGGFSKGNNTDVKDYPIPQSNWEKDKKQHICQKPLELIKELIIVNSKENDLIFDPFMGSWTTAVAAQALHRRFIGAELSEKYCEIGRQRLRQQVLI